MIEVVVDDLGFMAVDAVLRPASSALDPVASVASRLDQAAGPSGAVQRKIQSALEVGSAVVTGAGELPAQFVIHAVIRGEHSNATAETVRRALASAWRRAADWGLERVAGPAVGAGAGQLELGEAARIMAETFEEHRRGSAAPTLLQIVADREDDRQIIEAAIRQVAS